MKESKKLRMISKAYTNRYMEFESIIDDILKNERVRSMDRYRQHSDITCLEHCFYVAYNSYLICKYFGLDYKSAARGAMLHDFFLYDWHFPRTEKGLHAFTHPYTALKNANESFALNEIEKDVIVKHMWPLTLIPPKFWESMVVTFSDKLCAFIETVTSANRARLVHRHILLKYRMNCV